VWVRPRQPAAEAGGPERRRSARAPARLLSVCDNTSDTFIQPPSSMVRHRRALDHQVPNDIQTPSVARRSCGTRSLPSGSRIFKRSRGVRPFDAFLTCGHQDLALRMERHCAMRSPSAVPRTTTRSRARVLPGLAVIRSTPLAKARWRWIRGIVTVVVRGGLESARRTLERLPSVRAGGESRRRRKPHRASGDHDALFTPVRRASLGDQRRAHPAVVGVEDVEDLIAELRQALG